MLKVHTMGKAVCGSYTRDIAETKAFLVNQYAQKANIPYYVKLNHQMLAIINYFILNILRNF